jgi:ABC-type transport system substrate-binding protein
MPVGRLRSYWGKFCGMEGAPKLAGNYWDRVLNSRVSRRRAIAATGALTASAAFLAACGGDDDDDSGGGSGSTPSTSGGGGGATTTPPTTQPGLLYDRVDETAQAVAGGTYTDSHPLVLTTFDPMFPGGHIRVARRGYSQLLRVTDGVLQGSDGSVEGDAAQSWEVSGDNLTITMKLEPGAKFPPIPPVDGRALDSGDVLFSWERLLETGTARAQLANSINPSAPIESITAPDDQTVVVKLAQPDVTIFSALSTQVLGTLYLLPKEAADENVIDIPRQAIGTGPYYLSEDSEIEYRWKKNPNFSRPSLTNGEPFIDEIVEPVITDRAAGGAQFRSGAILEYGLPAEEVLGAKKDNMDLLMAANPPTTFNERLYFGIAPDSPFKDERMRVAFMKTIDRDTFLDVAYNVSSYADEGLPVEALWEGSVRGTSYGDYWLDPRDASNFGDAGSNYVFDIAEAKKLIEATSASTPFEFDNTYGAPAPTSFPPSYYARAEIFLGMIESAGIWKQNRVLVDYRTEWSSEKFRFSSGQFAGTSWGPDTSAKNATEAAFFIYNSNGGYYFGGDSMLDDITAKARREFDETARMQLIYDLQKYEAKMMFNEKIGTAGSFALHWPAVRNVGVYQDGTNWLGITTPSGLKAWLDQTKAPFA